MQTAADLALLVRCAVPGLGTVERAVPLAEIGRSGLTPGAVRHLVQEAERKGDHARVRQLHDEALGRHPRNADLLNEAAWHRCTCQPEAERRPEEAVALARRAVEASGARKSHILDTLAEALLVAGQAQEAQRWNDAGLLLSPADPSLRARKRRIQEALAGGPQPAGEAMP